MAGVTAARRVVRFLCRQDKQALHSQAKYLEGSDMFGVFVFVFARMCNGEILRILVPSRCRLLFVMVSLILAKQGLVGKFPKTLLVVCVPTVLSDLRL